MSDYEDVAGQSTAPVGAGPLAQAAAGGSTADDLEPQLKYERLGADVKTILQDASATCLCLSEKVLALGTSTGNIHILDYSGNEVKRFALHSKPVKHISFDDKAEYVASCCGENYVSISGLYTDETNKYTFKRPITVVALEPRYASRKTHEFVTGDVRGRLKLSSQGWLGRSDHVLHQGEGAIRAVAWHSSTLVWANDVGIKVYDTNSHQFVGSISRPRGGRYADCYDCRLYLHEGWQLYVAWPDHIKVSKILVNTDPVSGAVTKRLAVTHSVPTDYFCLGAVPHGDDLAVLVYVTDTDPDQDQVGLGEDEPVAAAAAAETKEEQQQQQQQDDGGTQQQQYEADPAAAAGTDDAESAAAAAAEAVDGGSSEQQQQAGDADAQQQAKEADEQPSKTAGTAPAAAAAAAAAAAPINIPQPVKRPPRAANAIVRSPSGPSVLEEAAAAAVAAAAAAAAATPEDAAAAAAAAAVDTSAAADSAAAGRGVSGTGGGSSSTSPSKPPSRRVSPVVSFTASTRGGGGGAGGLQAGSAGAAGGLLSTSPGGAAGRPPRPGWSRQASGVSSRASDTATEHVQEAYVPPGCPLRPELRILSLSPNSSTPAGQNPSHTHHARTHSEPATQGTPSASCCTEKASDALTVKGYSDYLPSDYSLVPSYGNDFALASSGGSSRSVKEQAGKKTPAAAAAAAAGGRGGKSQGSGGANSSSSGGAASGAAAGSAGSRTAAAAAAASQAAAAGLGGSTAAGPEGDSSGAAPAAAAAAGEVAVPAAAAAAAAAAGDAGSSEQLLVEDFGEFMYFIVSPQDIVVGRHREPEDRISWFLGTGHFEAALSIAEADRSLPRAVWDTVVQAYLEYLTAAGKWSAAAAKLPQLLKDQGALWERWVYVFAQARQLPMLAPVLPTKRPALHSHCYDLVLQALLVDPAHHGQLLALVQAWPSSCFHPTALIDAIAQRMQRPGGDSRELWQALAVLYKSQGRPDLSLAVYLQLQLPSVFDFIKDHSLLSYLDEKAYLLMAIDEGRALELLAGHLDTLTPGAVVPGLLDAMAVCEGEGDAQGHETWRRRLFNYLDRVFQVDPSAGGEYAELCVHLYADYCPGRLMDFLQGSQTYPLEAALAVAEQRGMVDEQVYILSRMGNSRAALALIIERLADIPRAIEFVRLSRDDELVEELIDWALRSADTTGQLLDHIGGNINPLRVIQKIPEGLAIQRLRDRLRSIIADFRTQTSLREGCNAILRSDCLHLVSRLQLEVKRALPVVWVQRIGAHGGAGGPGGTAAHLAAAAEAAAEQPVPAAAVGGAHSRKGSGTGSVKDGGSADAAGAGGAGPKGGSTGAAAGVEGGLAPGTPGASPTKPRPSARSSSSSAASFLPAAAPAGKGPQWLKYCSGSGQAMAVAAGQDVPAAAMEALLGSSRSASPWPGAASISTAVDQASQPVRVWIGHAHASDETSCLLANEAAAMAGLQDSQQQQLLSKPAGSSSTGGSRRTSKHHRQRSSGQMPLPSLVAA